MIPGKDAQTGSNLLPSIAERWSPRSFGEKEVEDEKLLRIFEAARWAASSRNEQPWHFIVAQKGDEHYEKLFNGLDDGNKKWAWTAPVIVACLSKLKFDYKGYPNAHHAHDLGLAMGNLLAQATHEGLHIHQMAGIKPEVIINNFSIDAEKYKVVTMFVMGYADESRLMVLPEDVQKSETQERKRKPLHEIVSGGSLGKPPGWIKNNG